MATTISEYLLSQNITAQSIRQLQEEKKEHYENSVIERAIAKIFQQVDDIATGVNENEYISIKGNITDEAVDFFRERGFKVTPWYDKKGMFISWEK